jgi:hypothetical protein
MCASEVACGAGAACVAGRCQDRSASPAIATATRVLYAPVDVAYLRPGAAVATAGIATLGRGDGAIVLLRFSVPLEAEANVIEAYLLLERAMDVDADLEPFTLHTARVVGRWDSMSTSWARQPSLQEVNAPETRVWSHSPPIVRLEVRSLVERWRRRGKDEMGLALVADGASPRGMAFVLPARLELYVK